MSTIKPPTDAEVRQAAVDPTRSFLIQAPAGSGKTELLTDRILALLATVNRPEEIVAITFTRKAASEMHGRVLGKLRSSQEAEPHEAHKKNSWRLARRAMDRDAELGWNLLDYPARLSIRTIDSFCSWLVRGMPWLSALGGLPAVTDSAGDHYNAAARATLALADDMSEVAGFLEHMDVDTRAAQALIASMLGSRDQWLPILGSGSDAGQLLVNLREAVQDDLHSLAQLMPLGWADELAGPLSKAAQALQDSAKGKLDLRALLGWDGRPLGVDFDDLPQWQCLADAMLTRGGSLRRRLTVAEGFDAKSAHKEAFAQWLARHDDTAPWVSALADIRHAPALGYGEGQLDVLKDLVKVLWVATAQLALRFAEKSEVDFIEIALRATRALGTPDQPTDLLLALDASIRHLLVDEFQDTSQSQIRLLEQLTAGWMPDDGRTLFLVGDPMQSIYRFRKAEVGLFLKVQAEGLGGIPLTTLALTDNFRSQAHVVDWVNQVFEPLFPPVSHAAMGAITYSRAVAYHDSVPGLGVELHPVWRLEQDQASGSRQTEQAIAVQLARDALQRHPGSEHPVAILVRARGHLGDVVRRLGQEGILCRAVELESLKSRQMISDLVQLARALAHPGDRLAWLSLLRSPVCGLTLNSLHAVFGHDLHASVPSMITAWLEGQLGPSAVLPEDEARRLRHAAAVLLDERNQAGAIPFAAWVQECWERLGGFAAYPDAADHADAESLFRLIEKLAPYGALDPVELDDQLGRLYAAPNSTGHAVEVMTIHKSKGLQFDTVILMGLQRKSQTDQEPLVRIEQTEGRLLLGPIKPRSANQVDAVGKYLAERDKKRAAFEVDRLLYVAVTRAREQLHLIADIMLDDQGVPKPPPPSSLLGRLWPFIQQPQPPSLAEVVQGEEQDASSMDATPLMRLALDSLPSHLESPSFAEDGVVWRWTEQTGVEAVIGTVAHAWLERMGKDGIEHWPAERMQENAGLVHLQLSRAGLVGQVLAEATQTVVETLAATLSSARGRWLLQVARAYREWSLLDITGRVSVIDLAISDESGWLVVDYKTGVPGQGESVEAFAHRMRERHGAQLDRYCRHVAALDGRSARGALYFPRVDLWVETGQE